MKGRDGRKMQRCCAHCQMPIHLADVMGRLSTFEAHSPNQRNHYRNVEEGREDTKGEGQTTE